MVWVHPNLAKPASSTIGAFVGVGLFKALSFGLVMDPNGSLVLDCFTQITAYATFQNPGTGIGPGTTLLLKPELKQDHGNNLLLEPESTLLQGCKYMYYV